MQTSTINQAGQTETQTDRMLLLNKFEALVRAMPNRHLFTRSHPQKLRVLSLTSCLPVPTSPLFFVFLVAFPLYFIPISSLLFSLLFPFCFHLRDLNVIYQTPLMPTIRLGEVVLHPPQGFSTLCLTRWKAYILILSFITSLPLSITVLTHFSAIERQPDLWDIKFS